MPVEDSICCVHWSKKTHLNSGQGHSLGSGSRVAGSLSSSLCFLIVSAYDQLFRAPLALTSHHGGWCLKL